MAADAVVPEAHAHGEERDGGGDVGDAVDQRPRQAGERHAEQVPQCAEDEADDQRVPREIEAEAAEERANPRLGMRDAVAALGADDEDGAHASSSPGDGRR